MSSKSCESPGAIMTRTDKCVGPRADSAPVRTTQYKHNDGACLYSNTTASGSVVNCILLVDGAASRAAVVGTGVRVDRRTRSGMLEGGGR